MADFLSGTNGLKDALSQSFERFGQYLRNDLKGFDRVKCCISMFFCILIHGSSPADYANFEFYRKSGYERKKFITSTRFERMLSKLNTGDRSVFYDKLKFNEMFSDLLCRGWLDATKCTEAEFADFVKKYPTIIVKPVDSFGGHGIWKHTYNQNDNIHELFERAKGCLVEECLIQHPDMEKLNSNCVNTLRIVTIRGKSGKAGVGGSFLRTGCTDACVDNFCSGGAVMAVELENGITVSGGYNLSGKEYLIHPVTKQPLIGVQIPHWNIAKETVKKAAERVENMGYVGWDVAITKDGVALIEGNSRGEYRAMQIPAQSGLYRQYKALM